MTVKQAKLMLGVLSAMRKNSRTPITAIAKSLEKPITTVFEAEKQLRQDGIVKRYYSSFRFERLGYGIRVLFILKEECAAEIENNPSLNCLQRLSGNLLLAEFLFSSMKQQLEIEKLFGNRMISRHYIFEQCREENAQIIFKNVENPSLQ